MASLDELGDQLILSLRRATATHGVSAPLMVLIDRAVSDPFEDALGPEGLARHVVRISHDDLMESRLPYLLYLVDPERSEKLLNATVHLALQEAHANLGSSRQVRTVCAWIQLKPHDELRTAEKHSISLARHIARASVITTPEGERRLFRYFDPRVLERLETVARPRQWAHLLGEGAVWHYIGRDLSLRTLHSSLASGEAAFDAAQWRRLARMGWVNELLPQAAEWGLNGKTTEVAERIDAQLARAQQRGLLTDTDCMTFATCAFCVHARFDEHPLFARALSAAARGELSFADAAASLDEQQLEAVAAGEWLADSPRSHRHG